MIGETLGNFGRGFARAPIAWLMLAAIAIATNLIDLVVTAGHMFGTLQIVSILLRLVGVYWFAAVCLRRLIGRPASAWTVDRGIAFFLAWTIGVFVISQIAGTALSVAARLTLPLAPAQIIPATLASIALGGFIVELFVLRIVPWLVARTVRDDAISFGSAWQAMRSHWVRTVAADIVLVLPLSVLHLCVTAWLQLRPPAHATLVSVTVVDGVESVLLVAMGLSLYAAAYARAKR